MFCSDTDLGGTIVELYANNVTTNYNLNNNRCYQRQLNNRNFLLTVAAGPFAAELMSDADAEVCSSIEYCSALGDSMDPVGTSRSSDVDFL